MTAASLEVSERKVRLPFGPCRFFVQSSCHLFHHVTDQRLNSADLVEVRAIADAGDGQRRALGGRAADFQMSDDTPFEGAVSRPDLDALPCEAVSL